MPYHTFNPPRRKNRGLRALLLLLIMAAAALFYAGRFLVYDENPRKADVIIVLAGDKGTRTEKGVELYQEGYAPYLIMSGGEIYHGLIIGDLMKEHATELGVPPEAVISEPEASSTYENAVFTRNILEEQGFKTALVVSSNYHMRRVKYVFDKEFKNTGIALTYVAAADPNFDPAHWWENNESCLYVFNEYIKFVGYILGLAGK